VTAYTLDFKRRAVAKLANGCRIADVSKAAGVPRATILRWRAEMRAQREAQVQASRDIVVIV
jgi:transposase-like protein